jgi:hypothetical protein
MLGTLSLPSSSAAFANHRLLPAAYAVIGLTLLLPLGVIDLPILADYPNHLARAHIFFNHNDSIYLDQYYLLALDLIPNLAMDLIVPALAEVLPLDLAGRLFLAMVLLTPLAGTILLHHALHDRWSPWPLLAAFFAYHANVMAGLLNFSLGIGLMLIAAAFWIRCRYQPPLVRLLLGGAAATVLFFCHLVALGAYGVIVLGYELGRMRALLSHRSGRPQAVINGLVLIGQLLPAIALFAMSPLAEAGAGVVYGPWSWMLKAMLAPLANYHLGLDLASAAVLLLLFLIGWRSGAILIHDRIAPALLAFFLLLLAAPKGFLSGGLFDQRFATILVLVLVAGTRLEPGSRRRDLMLGLGLGILLALRLGVLTTTWIEHRADLAEFRRAAETVPAGARILVARPPAAAIHPTLAPRHQVFHHAEQLANLAALAVIERDAFVSVIYALPGQQPLALTPAVAGLGGRGPVDLPDLEDLAAAFRHPDDTAPGPLRRWWRDFDHLVLIHPGSAKETAPGLPLEKTFEGGLVAVYRITNGRRRSEPSG